MSSWNEKIIKEFRENDGKVGGNFENTPLVLLHTSGAKSGKGRVNPMAYFEDHGRLVVIASKGGADSHPDWYYNLKANPEVHVEVGADVFEATATITEEPERTQLFAKMAARNPAFADYEKKTNRVIPVITLSRS